MNSQACRKGRWPRRSRTLVTVSSDNIISFSKTGAVNGVAALGTCYLGQKLENKICTVEICLCIGDMYWRISG